MRAINWLTAQNGDRTDQVQAPRQSVDVADTSRTVVVDRGIDADGRRMIHHRYVADPDEDKVDYPENSDDPRCAHCEMFAPK